MPGPTHNLNIQEYSLEELLGLFELKSYDISVDDLKRCKKKVLMLEYLDPFIAHRLQSSYILNILFLYLMFFQHIHLVILKYTLVFNL